jgi:chromate transport protein ChrA
MSHTPRPAGRVREVLNAFLLLGLTSFGGPIAHLGYFRTEFVERRRWLTERAYADLVALCQFLPGPASSQVGFALGLMRGANAAVVGILGAALYQPVWTSAILGPREFALALTGFLLLSVWKLPAWAVVALLAGGGVMIAP